MTYTVPSTPPARAETQRRSRWAELFDECREHPGQWRRIVEPLSKSTASQIASDIRNAYHREPGKSRLRGLRKGEHWEAIWGKDPNDTQAADDDWFIWLRFLDSRPPASPPTTRRASAAAKKPAAKRQPAKRRSTRR